MYFSLILGTLNRTDELEFFLESLLIQSLNSFELIVVDQNTTLDISLLIEKYKSKFQIIHLKSKKGLSKARNLGIKHASGEWLAFPDDDCEYQKDTLEKLKTIIENNPNINGLSTLVIDKNGKFSAGGFMSGTRQIITRKNIWRTTVSSSVFVKKSDIKSACFDEILGVGAGGNFSSGEESDYLLQLIEHDMFNILYIPDVIIYHPAYSGPWNKTKIQQGFYYGCGMGAVLRKHHYNILNVLWFVFLQFIRFVQCFLMFKLNKSFFHFNMALGRLFGFNRYKSIKR